MMSARVCLRLSLFLGLLLASGVGSVSPALACWPYVSGHVECSNGDPATNVPVSIYRHADGFCGAGTYSGTTDANGNFSICVTCTGNTDVTVNGETRSQYVSGNTNFGTWYVSCGVDLDEDGVDDAVEQELAQKFSPVLHKHSYDHQPDLADIDRVFEDSRLKIIDLGANLVVDWPLSDHVLHVTDTLYFCTNADDSLYLRNWVDFADGWRYQGAPAGERPLYYHVYKSGSYFYIQYWYFLTMNDLQDVTSNDTWHEGDWEHITLRVSRIGDDYVPDLINFYHHEGGHTRTAAATWWSPTNATTYTGIQQGYDEGHTHPHVWIAANSHASYNRYDPVYRFQLDALWGAIHEDVIDNVDYEPDGIDLYFPYDVMKNMGEVDTYPWDHNGDGRTFDYHRFHLPVDEYFDWLEYVGRIGDHWIAGFGCPWGDTPETPAPHTPATGELSHEWLAFTVNSSYGGFGNTGGEGCKFISDGGTITWETDPPDGDGTCSDVDGDTWTDCAGDCDDYNPAVNPGAAEVCNNGIDENCDGQVNEGCPSSGEEYYPRETIQSHLESGIDDCMAESASCHVLRDEDMQPLAPTTDIVMSGGGWTGSCFYMGWRCPQEQMDVYINDPGLSWPVWCLADNEAYTLFDSNRYDFRGVSVQGCTPLPFQFEYSFLCSSDVDCDGDDFCNPATGLCDTPCPDLDGDGWDVCEGDCNDDNPNVHPGHSEVCSTNYDDDCDGAVNEGCGGGGSPVFRKDDVQQASPSEP